MSGFSHSIASNGASQSSQLRSGLGEFGMRDHAKSAEPLHVLDDAAGVAAERIRRRRACRARDSDPRRADFDRVEAQHAGSVGGRIGRARGVAVVGEDDELQARARRRRGTSSGALRPSERLVWTWRMPGMVPSANDGSSVSRAGGRADAPPKRQRRPRRPPLPSRASSRNCECSPRPARLDGIQHCTWRFSRSCSCAAGLQTRALTVGRCLQFRPALRAAALSVRSQVNSGSVRPKWPNAAVFL